MYRMDVVNQHIAQKPTQKILIFLADSFQICHGFVQKYIFFIIAVVILLVHQDVKPKSLTHLMYACTDVMLNYGVIMFRLR